MLQFKSAAKTYSQEHFRHVHMPAKCKRQSRCVVQVAPGDAPPAEPPAPHEAGGAERASEDASARQGDSIREPAAADATVSPAPEPAPDHQARPAFTPGLEPALHAGHA